MRLKYFLMSSALIAMVHAWAVKPMGAAMYASQEDESPAYDIVGKDSTCSIFVYSPGPDAGLHLAYFSDKEKWVDVGRLWTSDSGEDLKDPKMYNPFVTKANDGTWRALWSVGTGKSNFAVAYSEDLLVWRPLEFPVVRERSVSDAVAYQMDDGSFDIYLRTDKGKRYVQGSSDFRVFQEDSLEASADDILWERDTATVGGHFYQGSEFDVPAVHLNYIRSWFRALAEDRREDSRPLPKTEKDLGEFVPEARLVIDVNRTKRISDKLMGVSIKDFRRAAVGGLDAEMLQNVDSMTVGSAPVYKKEWGGLLLHRGNSIEGKAEKHADVSYDVAFKARCRDGKNKSLVVALVDKSGLPIAEAKVKVLGTDWAEYKAVLTVTDKYKGDLTQGASLAIFPKGDNLASINLVSLKPQDTFKEHGLCRELAEAIADLQPKFVRFPGNQLHVRGMGTEDCFRFCSDVAAEPLPVLQADMQSVLDLMEWAKGKYSISAIEIVNDGLISTDFEKRYLAICKMMKQNYPGVEVIGTAGRSLWPSPDYVEGWKVAKDHRKLIDAVGERSVEQPGWFVNHQGNYDSYDRKQAKVCLSELASCGADEVDNALAEGVYLCHVERNGDIVERVSYAPFNNKVRASESYQMLKMFSTHRGDVYLESHLDMPEALKRYVGVSVVKDSNTGKTWLKVVNALPRKLKLSVSGMSNLEVVVEARKTAVWSL